MRDFGWGFDARASAVGAKQPTRFYDFRFASCEFRLAIFVSTVFVFSNYRWFWRLWFSFFVLCLRFAVCDLRLAIGVWRLAFCIICVLQFVICD